MAITFDSKNPPKTIPLGQEPWNVPPKTLPSDFDFDQSKSALSQSQSLSQKVLGGIGSLTKSIEQPFVSLAAKPVQLLAKGLGQPDPYADKALAGIDVTEPTVKGTSGDVLKAGATIGAVAAAPASIPAAMATGAGVGAAASAGQALQEDKGLGQVAKEGAVGGLIGGVGTGLIAGAGKLLQGAGKAAYKFLVPRSAREAQLLQSYKAKVPFSDRLKAALSGEIAKGAPLTVADTSFAQGLKGTESMMGVQAKRASTSIWDDVISPKLSESKQVVDMPSFFDDVAKAIVKDTPELSRQKSLLDALNALREDYAGVSKATLLDLQKFKEGWAKFIPEKVYRGQPIAGAFKDVTAKASDLARKTIYSSLGNDVKQAYFDYGNLQAIKELGQKAMTGSRLKGGFGGFWSAIKDMTLTPVATVGGRTVYRTGEGLEFIGKNGAGVLSDILSPKSVQLLFPDIEAK